MVAADTVFTPGDLGRFASVEGHAIAGRRDPPPSPPHRYALGVEDGRVTRVLDRDPANPLASRAALAARQVLRPALLNGSAARRSSCRRRSSALIDAGETVHGVEIGPTRDLTHPLDCLEQNFTYLRAL